MPTGQKRHGHRRKGRCSVKRALMSLCVLMVLSTVAWGGETKKVLGQRISGPTKHDPVAYRTKVEGSRLPGRFQAVQMSANSLAVIDTAQGYVWVTLATREGAGILYLGDLFPVDESFTQIHFKSAKTDDVPRDAINPNEVQWDDVPIGAPVPDK